MHLKYGVAALLLGSLFFGCHLGPKYVPPAVEAPAEWKGGSQQASPTPAVPIPCLDFWWEVFDDAPLNYLEQQAIENNPNLTVAIERVIQARAMAGVKKADLFPQITLNPLFSDTGELFQLQLPPGFDIPGVSAGKTVYRIHQFEYSLPLNLSYELDLWGKLRGQYQSARQNAQSLEFAYYSSLLSLTSDVASSYYQLRSLDAQIDLYQATIEAFSGTYYTVKSRFDKGLTNYLDLLNATLQITNAQAGLEDLKRQRAQQEDALAVLIGAPASTFSLEHNPLYSAPPSIPAGIPSAILSRRPDIAQAERSMASEHALIGVAYASFLPSITLTEAFGFISPVIKKFLEAPSRYWLLGANAAQSVSDGGRNVFNLEGTKAAYRESVAAYQQSVLVAFREVEDALNGLEMQYTQSTYLALSVETAEKGFELSLNRYKNGLTNYLDVMDSQRSQLAAKTSYTQLQGVRFLSTIQLIKALGGGWEG